MALKVLTVDDSKTIRMIVKKAFQPYNCVVFEAENGVEGLAAATKEKPGLIILDITMPVMTGIEMLDRLKGDAGPQKHPRHHADGGVRQGQRGQHRQEGRQGLHGEALQG